VLGIYLKPLIAHIHPTSFSCSPFPWLPSLFMDICKYIIVCVYTVINSVFNFCMMIKQEVLPYPIEVKISDNILPVCLKAQVPAPMEKVREYLVHKLHFTSTLQSHHINHNPNEDKRGALLVLCACV